MSDKLIGIEANWILKIYKSVTSGKKLSPGSLPVLMKLIISQNLFKICVNSWLRANTLEL